MTNWTRPEDSKQFADWLAEQQIGPVMGAPNDLPDDAEFQYLAQLVEAYQERDEARRSARHWHGVAANLTVLCAGLGTWFVLFLIWAVCRLIWG